MRRSRWWVPVAGLLLLAGCATQPTKQLPALSTAALAAASARQATHEAWVQAHLEWSLQGRVALANGPDGGSGRIEWRQQGPRYEVSLSAPITRQSWRLDGDEGDATLSGLDGGPRTGTDPAVLLREATRWEIPVTALATWVRGARASEARHGAAVLTYGSDGRLARLQQAGWTIDYGARSATQGVELPLRLDARRADARVRLIIDRWGSDAGP